MRPLIFKAILVVLFVAVTGYFFDMECLVNHCETPGVSTSVDHGECRSPVVMPDGISVPAVPATSPFLPVWATTICLDRPPVSGPSAEPVDFPLRPPPEHLGFQRANSRRGPPLPS